MRFRVGDLVTHSQAGRVLFRVIRLWPGADLVDMDTVSGLALPYAVEHAGPDLYNITGQCTYRVFTSYLTRCTLGDLLREAK